MQEEQWTEEVELKEDGKILLKIDTAESLEDDKKNLIGDKTSKTNVLTDMEELSSGIKVWESQVKQHERAKKELQDKINALGKKPLKTPSVKQVEIALQVIAQLNQFKKLEDMLKKPSEALKHATKMLEVRQKTIDKVKQLQAQ